VRRRVFKALWYDLPIARAGMLTTISTFSAESIERYTGYPASRIALVPPPLSSEFTRNDREFNAARPRILQVGTTANKNIVRVIRALAGLEVELVLIGELTELQRGELAAAGIAYENRTGITREALIEEYQRADIVMFASVYEGFGMPIIEAQAVGRPVITSDRCSMPEAAGGAAILVDPEDTGAIRGAVEGIATSRDRREELVAKGYDNARRFLPQRIADQYAELYRQLAR
ncbi:MAG: glycosyltransferase, partial [Tsuneonella sp.]